ncbi:MAG: response regulator transcription factor [Deltaproteobacteria bacterium]|nr:response regulator transcription factor [Deltaproteobacteria bacterium]
MTAAASTFKPRVLIIDDDEELNALLTEYLGRYGFVTATAAHPEEGLRAIKAQPPDILVLDVMLPGMDGFAVCRKVRETSRVPIVMLTARGDVPDRILGLELGADDYLPKPFEPRELVARLNAVLRRGPLAPPAERIRVGELELDVSARMASLQGRALCLTTAEFELLCLLVRHRGRVLSRERILDETRGLDWEAFDRSIDVLVSRLRHKLGDDSKNPGFIKTIWGRGYSFVGGEGG